MPKCLFCKITASTGEALLEHIELKHPNEAAPLSHSSQRKLTKKVVKKLPRIVVDGNSVAFYGSQNGVGSTMNLKKIRAHLQKVGYDPIIIVSADLKSKIDSPIDLIRLVNLTWILESDDDLDKDVFALEEAQRKHCEIISNETYSEHLNQFKTNDWSLKDSIRHFEIKDGKIEIK